MPTDDMLFDILLVVVVILVMAGLGIAGVVYLVRSGEWFAAAIFALGDAIGVVLIWRGVNLVT